MTAVVAIQLLEGGRTPVYSTKGAAGADVCAAIGDPIIIGVGDRVLIPCGFKIALPPGYEAQIRPRSGLAVKRGLGVLNSPGTIDEDYRGEVGVILINHGEEPVMIEPYERIAQMVIKPVEQALFVNAIIHADTERGEGGYGSTGKV